MKIKRTRPSNFKVGVIVDDQALDDAEAGLSYQIIFKPQSSNTHVDFENPRFSSKFLPKLKNKRVKTAQDFDVTTEQQQHLDRINEEFEEIEDFQLSVQKIYKDRYVMVRSSLDNNKAIEQPTNESFWSIQPSPSPFLKPDQGYPDLTLQSNGSTPHKIAKFDESPRTPYYLRTLQGEHDDLNVLLHVCNQTSIQTWNQFLQSCSLRHCKKIGEGTYGEVFSLEYNGEEVALKIIPFAFLQKNTANILVNGERLKDPLSLLPELLITKELSALAESACPLYRTTGFVRLIEAIVVKGKFPRQLLDKWDDYASKKGTENDHPTQYDADDRFFILFALSSEGTDLESFKTKNDTESLSVFFQCALSLSIAEEVLEFEHRDLHKGNLLIKRCPKNDFINYTYKGEVMEFNSAGVSVSIIDFTCSRIKKGGTLIFLDLSEDDELFNGDGLREGGDYQFDVYRIMREKNRDIWKDFTPSTNLVWLHYLARVLLTTGKQKTKWRKKRYSIFEQLLEVDRVANFLALDAVKDLLDEFV